MIESRQDSGLSIKDWCRQNDMSESQYYYYLRKLRLAACEDFPEKQQEEAPFALVPKHARVSRPVITEGSNIKITLQNAVVEIGAGAKEAHVRLALEVLLHAQ
ncbi:MAG: hypothetical protein PHQ50_06880 [Eubacteriales bacterium]|nr:hypothetical protein [Eubacteriales bacterium]